MIRAPLVGLCVLLTVACATVPQRLGVRVSDGIQASPAPDQECDSPLNGALIGAALGGSPILVALVRRDGERNIPFFFAAMVGAIAGFWIGIGVDEAHCEPEP